MFLVLFAVKIKAAGKDILGALQLGKEGTVIHCFIDRGGWLGFGHLMPSHTGGEGSAGVSLRRV